MANKLAARVVHDIGGAPYLELTANDAALVGKPARIEFVAHGDVTRGGGIDVSRTLDSAAVTLSAQTRVPLPPGALTLYRYDGRQLRMGLRATVYVNDGILFDTTESFDLDCPWFERDCAARDVAKDVDPPDTFNFMRNLRAIPHAARIKVIAMTIVGGLVIGVNLLVGTHDQFVPESRTFFYDHSGSKGKSESPLEKALAGSGAFGLGLWFAIRAQLRRYLKLELRKPSPIARDTRVPARDLIAGVPHVAIDFAKVRVVAYNRERGRYQQKSNKKTETKSFSSPVRAVCLYEQDVMHLGAGAALASQLSGDIDFGRVYEELLPPLLIDPHTGIDVHWELQFLHKDFVDHEITGADDVFDPALFHPAPR
jgi:hypothetical protein